MNIPAHVAVIMDGNGRWATERGLPRVAGHKAGADSARHVLHAAAESGVKVLTFYAFSQENWKRPKTEVSVLMNLLDFFLKMEVDELHRHNIKVRTIGRIEALPAVPLNTLREAVERTANNTGLVLNLALNYSARTEILDAVAKLLEEQRKNPDPIAVDEKIFEEYLYTAGLPDPDLLIRTSGEMRLSNFLLWQLSYAELYITKKYWPDFTKADFMLALEEYSRRQRRFGDVAHEIA